MAELKPVLLLVLALAAEVCTWPQDIVFSEEHSDVCTLLNGGQGRCVDIQSCPAVLDTFHHTPPVHCKFIKDMPVVCCPTSKKFREMNEVLTQLRQKEVDVRLNYIVHKVVSTVVRNNRELNIPDDVSSTLLDISPPNVNFGCGENPTNSLILQLGLESQPQILRPESPIQTVGGDSVRIPSPAEEEPNIRPGVPEEARDKLYEELAVLAEQGYYATIGGIPANKSAWPWMALIGENDPLGTNWFCGGVLINDQWILSALHCFLRKRPDVVRLGEHDYNDEYDNADHEDFGVAETIIYPDYKSPQAYHDLALLKLATKVTLKKYISPVCLPWGKEVDISLTGQKVTLAGWGDTLFGGFPSSVLQEVNVTVFPSSTCDTSYSTLQEYSHSWPRGITDEIICAGDPNGGRDACQGDSGGPIVYLNSAGRFTLAGIVSRGFGCGLKEYPGLYANIHQPKYLSWIKKTAF